MNLSQEARWAWNELHTRGLCGPEDSSLMAVSWNALESGLNHLVKAFDHPNASHCVAIKTQPHPGVLKRLTSWGFGLEAASIEEVHLAKSAGAPHIVFDSPVKRLSEISVCQSLGAPMLLNVNSLEELTRMPDAPTFQIGIRVNPQIQTDAPKIFQVSSDESKFGVPLDDRDAILAAIRAHPVEALHVHSGSSMLDMSSAVTAVKHVVDLAQAANALLEKDGMSRRIRIVNIGGGMLPEILSEAPSAMMRYAKALRAQAPALWTEFNLVTEFGQWVHFYTGYAYSDVEYALDRGSTRVAFVHLGADFLMRDVYAQPREMKFEVLSSGSETKPIRRHDLAGPLCFAGDYIGRGVALPQLEQGDVLLMLNTGANALGLWSRHCSRSIPKFVGVDGRAGSLEILSERTNPFV